VFNIGNLFLELYSFLGRFLIFSEFSDNYGLDLMARKLMKVIHIENLFHLLIFLFTFFSMCL